ncbi:uncharacterized protein MYCFIDRAFT_174630 [Pseudocercospora fijiensis CIRAD86]|uniref:Uncharacterized protein n=1 Tax=Pseudocercospora fijiensis (strain CIRAD86) TaxID=383855 RepID=M3B1A7_PSEFD|nr:uncharacterized protein MYCFIDRAFT_174630 [Pseudocercospora fijiensis CIRAD86]EME83158.1 hypothetical protein MYCFIDRAFT_174630 [Pseudocercospora fijiensis CIRAD86]
MYRAASPPILSADSQGPADGHEDLDVASWGEGFGPGSPCGEEGSRYTGMLYESSRDGPEVLNSIIKNQNPIQASSHIPPPRRNPHPRNRSLPNPVCHYANGNTALESNARQPVHSDIHLPHPLYPFAYAVNVPLGEMSGENGSTTSIQALRARDRPAGFVSEAPEDKPAGRTLHLRERNHTAILVVF